MHHARDFDIHVYYKMDDGSREKAVALREQALKDFKDLFVSRMVDRKVGPHPQPMFEITFGRERLAEMIQWLIQHRNGLVVLIHQVSERGDTLDHSEGAMWMGEVLPLDFSIFST